jgi:plasmid stabilization system protein ParE
VKVAYTAQAKRDLIEIGVWIAHDNPARAKTFVAELYGVCEALGDAPRSYPLLQSHRTSGVRRRPYKSYLIFYWIMESRVEVLHVLHSARDYEAILFPQSE